MADTKTRRGGSDLSTHQGRNVGGDHLPGGKDLEEEIRQANEGEEGVQPTVAESTEESREEELKRGDKST
jgi:hypothetical protein